MVKISKNGKRMEVPSAAFENFYRSAGWSRVAEDRERPKKEPAVEEEPYDPEWDEALESEEGAIPEGVEKPIAQMNHQELLDKALSMGIDVAGNPSSKQLREMIRKNA